MANVNLTIPSVAATGDFLWAAVLSFAGDSTLNAQPAGWTSVRTIQIQDGATADIYTKVALASDHGKAATWIVTGSLVSAGVMLDVANSPGEDIYGAAGYSPTSIITSDATFFKATAVGELLLALYIAAASVDLTPPAPWTVIQQIKGPQLSFMFGRSTSAVAGNQPSLSISIAPVAANALAVTLSFLGASSLRAFATA